VAVSSDSGLELKIASGSGSYGDVCNCQCRPDSELPLAVTVNFKLKFGSASTRASSGRVFKLPVTTTYSSAQAR